MERKKNGSLGNFRLRTMNSGGGNKATAFTRFHFDRNRCLIGFIVDRNAFASYRPFFDIFMVFFVYVLKFFFSFSPPPPCINNVRISMPPIALWVLITSRVLQNAYRTHVLRVIYVYTSGT